MIPINFYAVLANVLLAMVLGFVWYGPLFGNVWMREAKMSPADANDMQKKGMGSTYAMMALGALIMSFTLAHSNFFAMTYLNMFTVAGAVQGAFWNWIGYIAPVLLGGVLWERKSWKWWAISTGYYLALLILMSLVLLFWV